MVRTVACLLLCSLATHAQIALEPRQVGARSALLAVDSLTARRVQPVGAWETVNPPGGGRLARFVDSDSAEGERCATLVSYERDPAASPELRQLLAEIPDSGEYRLSLESTGTIGARAEVLAVVEGRADEASPWTSLLRMPLTALDGWIRSDESFRIPGGLREVRVVVRLLGKGTALIDDARLTRSGDQATNLLRDGGFEGVASWCLEIRKSGSEEWRPEAGALHESVRRVFSLEPETRYEARAFLQSVSGARIEESVPIYFDTLARWEDSALGLRAEEPTRLGALGLHAPALVSDGLRPLLVACYGNGVYAHPIEFDGTLGEPVRVVQAVEINGSPAEVGDVSACVLGECLYVLYRFSHGPLPEDQTLRLAGVRLGSGELLAPHSVRALDPDALVSPGGLAEVGGQLHVAFGERGGIAGPRAVIRSYDPESLEPLEEEATLGGALEPSLGRLGERLVLFASERRQGAREDQPPDVEPVILTARLLGAEGLGEPILLGGEGLNRRAVSMEIGERLAVVWEHVAPGAESVGHDAAFRDLAFAWLHPEGYADGPWLCVADSSYNESPAVGMLMGEPFLAARKRDRNPLLPDGSSTDLSVWGVRLRPAEDR